MALINCPECDTNISDQAHSCPKCGYPIASKRVLQEEIKRPLEPSSIEVNRQNNELLIAMTSKKNAGIAFLFTFFFGPFGLFYVDSKKAVNLIVIGIIGSVILLIVDQTATLYIIFWGIMCIVSIMMSLNAVSEYNNKIISPIIDNAVYSSQSDNLGAYDRIGGIRKLILLEHKKPFYAQSQKDKITFLLEEVCIDKTHCHLLINEYKNRYRSNIIDDLKSLSTTYLSIKAYLKSFIAFGLVAPEYPHEML